MRLTEGRGRVRSRLPPAGGRVAAQQDEVPPAASVISTSSVSRIDSLMVTRLVRPMPAPLFHFLAQIHFPRWTLINSLRNGGGKRKRRLFSPGREVGMDGRESDFARSFVFSPSSSVALILSSSLVWK